MSNIWKDFEKLFVGADQLISKSLSDPYDLLTTYPPYNTYKTDTGYKIELAVAGYSINDIDIVVDEKTLIITGKKSESEEKMVPIFRGLSRKAFTKKFLLSEYINRDDIGAELKDGILIITLTNLPEKNTKARKVDIKG